MLYSTSMGGLLKAIGFRYALRRRLEFEVRGHKFNRLQNAVEFQFLICIHDVIDDHRVRGLALAARDLTFHCRVVGSYLHVVETRSMQSQQRRTVLDDELDRAFGITFDSQERSL